MSYPIFSFFICGIFKKELLRDVYSPVVMFSNWICCATDLSCMMPLMGAESNKKQVYRITTTEISPTLMRFDLCPLNSNVIVLN